VKRVISTSTEGFSRVGIELRLEIDPQAATAEVREKVAAIRERLPEQIKDPTIQRFDVSALPIATYAVGSTSFTATKKPGRLGRMPATSAASATTLKPFW